MNVDVSPEFCGSARFRLTFLHNRGVTREYVRADTWTRATATEALDMLQFVYGVARRSVRFIHH